MDSQEFTPFGYHLVADCYDCDIENLENITFCYDFLEKVITLLKMEKQSQPYVFLIPEQYEDKRGISGWVPLVESGVSIQTLSNRRFVSIDVYSCKFFSKDLVLNFVNEMFKPTTTDHQILQRGRRYNSKFNSHLTYGNG